MDNLVGQFLSHLENRGIAKKTLRFYKSDLKHFAGWVILRINSLGSPINNFEEAIPFLSSELAHEYKNFLSENKLPIKTVNRRLSTLRSFGKFLASSQILLHDFASGLKNLTAPKDIKEDKETPTRFLLDEFEKHLVKEKVSHNTVKNYLSDIRHFLNWLEKNNATA